MQQEDLILKYFEGQLSDDEQLEFDALLHRDAAFQKEVTFQKNLKKAIAMEERNALKSRLQSYEPESTTRNRKPKYWMVAVVFLLFFGGLAWFQFQDPDHDNLFAAYYQTYPNTVAPTVRGREDESLKSQAFYSYDNSNYEESVKQFSLLYQQEQADYALFYKALSLIELQQFEASLTVFNELELSGDSTFYPFVKWYKALVHLKLGQETQALALLQTLANSENPQQGMARKLLSDLE